MEFITTYFSEAKQIIDKIDVSTVQNMVDLLLDTREKSGRLFLLGVGGSASNASHAVNDFRKITGIEAYAPTDNVSELTARTNDEGWNTVFVEWLKTSKLRSNDLIFVLSVGGGDIEKNISANLVSAIRFAKETGARVCGIVGRDNGYTAQEADACVVIPKVSQKRMTPHVESFQGMIWHLLVSHPQLQIAETKWESTK